jgi:hypothetical protein
MELNTIKKLLYTQNPKATFSHIRKGHAYYDAPLTDSDEIFKFIRFEIPVADMGDADFFSQMQAKHLIRWIVKTEEQPA